MSTASPGDEDNLKLLGAIPASARRILELGCGDGRLGRRFKQLRPGVQWWGVRPNTIATCKKMRTTTKGGGAGAAAPMRG
jgi:hypothetical protein